jgi:hypothetical protein
VSAWRAAQSYIDGPIVAALKASPVISNIDAKLFDVMESHTATTRGPVNQDAQAVRRRALPRR